MKLYFIENGPPQMEIKVCMMVKTKEKGEDTIHEGTQILPKHCK